MSRKDNTTLQRASQGSASTTKDMILLASAWWGRLTLGSRPVLHSVVKSNGCQKVMLLRSPRLTCINTTSQVMRSTSHLLNAFVL